MRLRRSALYWIYLFLGFRSVHTLLAKVKLFIDQRNRICYVAKHQYAAFDARDGPFGEEQAEQPQQDARTDQRQQVEISDSREVQWRDGGTATQYEEDIEQVAADGVSDGNLRIPLQGGNDGCGKLRQRRSACHKGKPDDRFAGSQAAGDTAGTILSLIHI